MNPDPILVALSWAVGTLNPLSALLVGPALWWLLVARRAPSRQHRKWASRLQGAGWLTLASAQALFITYGWLCGPEGEGFKWAQALMIPVAILNFAAWVHHTRQKPGGVLSPGARVGSDVQVLVVDGSTRLHRLGSGAFVLTTRAPELRVALDEIAPPEPTDPGTATVRDIPTVAPETAPTVVTHERVGKDRWVSTTWPQGDPDGPGRHRAPDTTTLADLPEHLASLRESMQRASRNVGAYWDALTRNNRDRATHTTQEARASTPARKPTGMRITPLDTEGNSTGPATTVPGTVTIEPEPAWDFTGDNRDN